MCSFLVGCMFMGAECQLSEQEKNKIMFQWANVLFAINKFRDPVVTEHRHLGYTLNFVSRASERVDLQITDLDHHWYSSTCMSECVAPIMFYAYCRYIL